MENVFTWRFHGSAQAQPSFFNFYASYLNQLSASRAPQPKHFYFRLRPIIRLQPSSSLATTCHEDMKLNICGKANIQIRRVDGTIAALGCFTVGPTWLPTWFPTWTKLEAKLGTSSWADLPNRARELELRPYLTLNSAPQLGLPISFYLIYYLQTCI